MYGLVERRYSEWQPSWSGKMVNCETSGMNEELVCQLSRGAMMEGHGDFQARLECPVVPWKPGHSGESEKPGVDGTR